MRDAFASRHIGQIVYAYRTHSFHGNPISQETVATWAGISQTQLSRIESGPPVHDLKRLTRWANILCIPQRLLWFDLAESSRTGETEKVSTSLRRDFVAIGSLTAGNSVIGALERELDMVHMTLDRGTTSEERVAYLEGVANDLGRQIATVAPLVVLRPTLMTIQSIRNLLEYRQPTRHQVRLVQASARLSAVLGATMFNLGYARKTREWYKTAEHAACDAGDLDSADIALAGRALLPMYSDDPQGVLELLTPRLDRNPSASPVIAKLWGFRARAHAALGEPYDFRRAIERARECLAGSPAELIFPGIFSLQPAAIAFYEATGLVRLNEPYKAISAADRALSLYDISEIIDPTLAKLERASALAQAGEIPEACGAAKAALRDPRVCHGPAVRTYARRFDELVRNIQSPETREWREVHAEVHGGGNAGAKADDREF